MMWMPFSPRWLVHHDRPGEARITLATLRGLPIDHELIELEFLEIQAQSLFEKRTVAVHFPHLSEPTAWNTVKLQFVAIGSLFKTMPMFRRGQCVEESVPLGLRLTCSTQLLLLQLQCSSNSKYLPIGLNIDYHISSFARWTGINAILYYAPTVSSLYVLHSSKY